MPKEQSSPKWWSKRPMGQVTRGKTGRNRLRRVDLFFALYDPWLLKREDGLYHGAYFIDLGYGAEPVTTLETAERLRRINQALHVLGVEIDPERVIVAQSFADVFTSFRLGGFNVPLLSHPDGRPETVRAVRAFNVLRQYEENAVVDAWTQISRCMLPGALLVEGTSDPFGRVWVANLLRKPEESSSTSPPFCQEGLVFSTRFHQEFDPAQFQPVLPKNYIHRMTPGEPIYHFMEAWKQAARETVAYKAWGPRIWFMASAYRLAAMGYHVCTRPKWLRRGYLVARISERLPK